MARGIRFCRTFLHVARVRKHTDMRELHAKTHGHSRIARVSHGRVFSDSRNVQKSVTRIIYLGPLPRAGWPRSDRWRQAVLTLGLDARGHRGRCKGLSARVRSVSIASRPPYLYHLEAVAPAGDHRTPSQARAPTMGNMRCHTHSPHARTQRPIGRGLVRRARPRATRRRPKRGRARSSARLRPSAVQPSAACRAAVCRAAQAVRRCVVRASVVRPSVVSPHPAASRIGGAPPRARARVRRQSGQGRAQPLRQEGPIGRWKPSLRYPAESAERYSAVPHLDHARGLRDGSAPPPPPTPPPPPSPPSPPLPTAPPAPTARSPSAPVWQSESLSSVCGAVTGP